MNVMFTLVSYFQLKKQKKQRFVSTYDIYINNKFFIYSILYA
jgi:hypothetical protein